MERNFRDTIDKIEIEMKEVKEKLSSPTASAEKSTQEGWQKELLKKIIKRGCQHPSKNFKYDGKSPKIRFFSYFHIL